MISGWRITALGSAIRELTPSGSTPIRVIDGIGQRVDLDIAYRDYPALIKSEGYNHLPAWMRILPGSRVRIRSTAAYYANSTVAIPPCVRGSDYTVLKVCGSTALLSCIHSWVRLQDLELISGPAD